MLEATQQKILLENKLEQLRRAYVKPEADRRMLQIQAKLLQLGQAKARKGHHDYAAPQ